MIALLLATVLAAPPPRCSEVDAKMVRYAPRARRAGANPYLYLLQGGPGPQAAAPRLTGDPCARPAEAPAPAPQSGAPPPRP